MEHRSKRRKTWEEIVNFYDNFQSHGSKTTAMINADAKDRSTRSRPSVTMDPQGASDRISAQPLHGALRPEIPISPPKPTRPPSGLQNRDILDGPAVETVVTSVVDVVFESGSSQIAEITLPALPTVPTVVSFPSYGPLTVPVFPTYPPQTLPTVPSYPFPSSAVPSSTASSSMSIQVPGASSQIVMSSPPSTPLPSESSMSLPSVSTTGGNIASVSTVSPTGNFSTTSFTSIESGTTFTGTTTLSLPYFAGNGTRSAFSSSFLMTAPRTSTTSSTLTFTTTESSSTSITTSHSLTLSSASSSDSGTGAGATAGRSGSPAGTTAGSLASSSAAAGAVSNQNPSPATPAVVGGVVGGVAGLTIILVFLLFLVRWKRRRMLNQQLRDGDPEFAPPGTAQSGMAMAESAAPLAGTGLVPFFRRLRPHSGQTIATTTTTASTERGFQNLGGRKIESVLVSGGDGYGGLAPNSAANLSTTSFYRDAQGNTYGGTGSTPSSMYVGPGSPPTSPRRPPVGASVHPDPRASDKEVAVLRSGPARTPVTTRGFESPPRPVPTRQPTPPPIIRPDAIGRSHPSFDGSRGLLFTSYVHVPAYAANASDTSLLTQWQAMGRRGKAAVPPLALLASGAHFLNAYLTRAQPQSLRFVAAGALSLAVLPYTAVALGATNAELEAREEGEGGSEDVGVGELVRRWGARSAVRGWLLLASAVVSYDAMLHLTF
ncbi:Mucin-21 [Xylographa soralifera]|nr:Mucin-21 [Xylographa soralifera]